MTATEKLRELLKQAEALGAVVSCSYDEEARTREGREIIQTVQINGLRGCGPHPMGAVAAAERLQECLSNEFCQPAVNHDAPNM